MRHGQEKEHLLNITSAVYKVTALFPVREELGRKIRESADRVLGQAEHNACARPGRAQADIEEILRLFDEAEKKNWVDPRNFLVLKREYENIRYKDGGRQDKILAVMAGNGAVKIGDLVKFFPGVNRRTVLRDLEVLCQTGVMVRNGIGRGAFYVKNGHINATLSQ